MNNLLIRRTSLVINEEEWKGAGQYLLRYQWKTELDMETWYVIRNEEYVL